MRTFYLALAMVLLILTAGVRAETAADVQPFGMDELMRIADASKISLDPAVRAGIAELVAALPEEKLRRFKPGTSERLRSVDAELTLKDVSAILTLDEATPVVAQLDEHEDPVLRFMASATLAGRGDSDAAVRVYEVLHSEAPTLQQKRVLATWAAGIGLHPATDTAESIYEHMSTVMGQEPKIKVGETAPDFEVTDINGETLTLKKLRGRTVLLHFWSQGCGPCVAGFPRLKAELALYPEPKLVVIAVSLDEDRTAFEEFVKEHALPWHNVCDGAGWGGEMARAYGVNRLPYDFVINPNGVVRSHEVNDLPSAITAAK